MNGIVINIDPVIFQIGGFSLRWYSLAIIVAIIAATLVAMREAKRKGISKDFILSMLPLVLIAGFIGARLFHVVDHWQYYAVNPLDIFQVQQGGLAIWGGLLAGGVAAVVFSKMKNVPIGRLADTLVPALLVAQIIGRFGCIVNGDAYGSITSLPWGFIYTHPGVSIPSSLAGVPTHPYPVYEMIWNGITLLVLLKFRHRIKQDGILFFSYLSVYSLGRFILTFVRMENTFIWQLQQAQLLALGTLVVSVTAIIVIYLKNKYRSDIDDKVKRSTLTGKRIVTKQ